MTLAKARADKTLTVQASLTIATYDHQNISIAQATAACTVKQIRRN
jgi:hypothetical protein